MARRDVALVYALFESDRAGRPVTIEEVEAGALDAYPGAIASDGRREEPRTAGLAAPFVAEHWRPARSTARPTLRRVLGRIVHRVGACGEVGARVE